MTSEILEIEEDEVVNINGTNYIRVPKGYDKAIGLSNVDGSTTTKKIRRAKIKGKHGVFMAIWGELQKKVL